MYILKKNEMIFLVPTSSIRPLLNNVVRKSGVGHTAFFEGLRIGYI